MRLLDFMQQEIGTSTFCSEILQQTIGGRWGRIKKETLSKKQYEVYGPTHPIILDRELWGRAKKQLPQGSLVDFKEKEVWVPI